MDMNKLLDSVHYSNDPKIFDKPTLTSNDDINQNDPLKCISEAKNNNARDDMFEILKSNKKFKDIKVNLETLSKNSTSGYFRVNPLISHLGAEEILRG